MMGAMSRRVALLLGLALAISVAGRPNIVFVVVDDLGVTTSNYGFPAKAPSMEALAARGVQFNRAYVSMSVCAPSRTAFLTGMRPDTTQIWTIGPYFRTASRGEGMQITTLPELFRRAGYHTTGVGKIFHPGAASGGLSDSEGGGDMCPANSATGNCTWQSPGSEVGSWSEPYWFCDQYGNDTVQSPAMQDWQCATGSWPSCGSGCMQDAECVKCFEDAGTWGEHFLVAETPCPDRCYPEGLIADQAIKVLERYAKTPEEPFFLGVGFKRPHLTYKAPKKYFDMYDVNSIPLPKHITPSPTMPAIAWTHSCVAHNHMVKPLGMVNDSCREDGLCTEIIMNHTMIQELRLAYYAVVSLMDFHLGRVMDALDRTGLANNTIVTVIGDHGYQNGEKGAWCKQTNFELANRIPMIVAAPLGHSAFDATRGTVAQQIVESVDLFPTIAELAGLLMPARQTVPGLSFAKVLGGQEFVGKGWALSQWPRRPSCLNAHKCLDGHGDPSSPENVTDQAIMGYTLRVENFRYTAWFEFDYEGIAPHVENVTARELYDHTGDAGDMEASESLEWDNLADEPEHQDTVAALHAQLLDVIASGLVSPMSGRKQIANTYV